MILAPLLLKSSFAFSVYDSFKMKVLKTYTEQFANTSLVNNSE